VQLQRSFPDLRKRGLGLAAISYDAPATLKAFADARGITFPMLSDEGSSTIKQYNLLNAQATGRIAGIPYPGTLVLDARGVVLSRSFEESYQERASAASLITTAQSAGASGSQPSDTPHLTVTTATSDPVVTPGTRFSLIIDVAPKVKMHVYSPDQTAYIPVSVSLNDDDAIKPQPPKFPASELYIFKPLNERQRVYSKPFRILQDVTVLLAPAVRERARAAGATLTVTGTLNYQACDDQVCYRPSSVPLSWTVRLEPLAR